MLPVGQYFVCETVRQTAIFGFWTKRFISQRRQRHLPADSVQLATFSLPPFVAVFRLGNVMPGAIKQIACICGLLSVALLEVGLLTLYAVADHKRANLNAAVVSTRTRLVRIGEHVGLKPTSADPQKLLSIYRWVNFIKVVVVIVTALGSVVYVVYGRLCHESVKFAYSSATKYNITVTCGGKRVFNRDPLIVYYDVSEHATAGLSAGYHVTRRALRSAGGAAWATSVDGVFEHVEDWIALTFFHDFARCDAFARPLLQTAEDTEGARDGGCEAFAHAARCNAYYGPVPRGTSLPAPIAALKQGVRGRGLSCCGAYWECGDASGWDNGWDSGQRRLDDAITMAESQGECNITRRKRKGMRFFRNASISSERLASVRAGKWSCAGTVTPLFARCRWHHGKCQLDTRFNCAACPGNKANSPFSFGSWLSDLGLLVDGAGEPTESAVPWILR